MAQAYPQSEDSEFLAGFVRAHARGKTLDMGTGSGVLAVVAAGNPAVTSVLAVDADPEVVRAAQASLRVQEKVSVRLSDMFSAIEGRFDTIICNPPYLPDDPALHDNSLDGGRGGFEWCERFLAEASSHLAPNGQVLLLFSSLTNKGRIDLCCRRLGYLTEELGELALFFERLFVYRLRRPS